MSSQQTRKALKRARKELGLTQEQVAEKAGISSNYYSMLETGRKDNPSSKVIEKIAKVLRLQTSDVFPF